MQKFILTLIFSVFTASMFGEPAMARSIQTVYSKTVTGSGKAISARNVENAIVTASAHRGWEFKKVAPGKLVGMLVVRGKHYVEIDVLFNSKEYRITYKDSKNMKYDPETKTIHKRYNSWVTNLDNDIKFYLLSK